MKVVANGATPEAHEINAVFRQGLLLIPTKCLLYNNDMPEIIFRSLVNTYVDDTTVYVCTLENQDGLSLSAELLSDLAVASQ